MASSARPPELNAQNPNTPSGSGTSFWKRAGARFPGSIRPTGSEHSGAISKLVIGAQHAFASPIKPDNPKEDSSSSPKPDRRSLKSRDDFVNHAFDAWGDSDQPAKHHSRTGSVQEQSLNESKLPSTTSAYISTSPIRDHSRRASSLSANEVESSKTSSRIAKFNALLQSHTVDLAALKKLAWAGIPSQFRPVCWQLLMGYLPCAHDRRDSTLQRKRKEYDDTVAQSLGEAGPQDKALLHQIHIDVKRTNPSPYFSHPRVQQALERVLYCWAMRHPASGYVQGINDLLTPFFSVFLSQYVADPTSNEPSIIDSVTVEQMSCVEADSFWCLTKLIDGIQDNYTFAQPGIQRLISRLKDLVGRIDHNLSAHLAKENVEFIQFAFRWMNCLLMREFKLDSTIRMWDTYLSEEGDLNDFHVYVCAAFLVKWSNELQSKSFPDIMLFLQSPPTKDWEEREIELLLSEAFMWKSLFHTSHHVQQ